MRTPQRNFKNIIFKAVLFSASTLCLCLGLALCLIKSPQENSQKLLVLASHYDERVTNNLTEDSQKFLLTEKKNIIHQAIQRDPNNYQTWIDLSYTLIQLDDLESAEKAIDIANILNASVNISTEDLIALLPENSSNTNKIARADDQFQLSFTY